MEQKFVYLRYLEEYPIRDSRSEEGVNHHLEKMGFAWN
jgi:hypothetical protein